MLPPPTALPAITLERVLRDRRSHYHYSAEPLPLTALADLLHHAVRILPRAKHGAETAPPLSSAPSAGGHNPVGVHLAARNVDGLDAGLYTYDRHKHSLTMTGIGDPSPSLIAIYGQAEFVDRVPVTVLLTVTLRDPIARYGLRHYRTLHIDTGVVTQNLYLVATALGLRGCAVAGYRDAAARQLLGCADDEITTMLFPIGASPP
jgi:SagB-type dehydrogenase family enzyme